MPEEADGVASGSSPATRHEPEVLRAGKHLHQQVQKAFVSGLLGVDPAETIEKTLVRPTGHRERLDICLLVPEERTLVVIEIKSTVWHSRAEKRQRALLRRHLAQMDGYLDLVLEQLGHGVDSVVAVLLYPKRPPEATVSDLEAIALPRGVMIGFYDDMNWRSMF
jgi:hypothetical protein